MEYCKIDVHCILNVSVAGMNFGEIGNASLLLYTGTNDFRNKLILKPSLLCDPLGLKICHFLALLLCAQLVDKKP